MAAELDISQIIEVTGLGGGDESNIIKFTSDTAPAETVSGKPIIADSAVTLDLGDIAAGSGFCLYLEALVGNLYVTLSSTSATPAANASHLYIPEGEGYVIPINPNATAMPGIRILSDDASGRISYKLIGS